WYGLPALQEDLERILAALEAKHGRGIAPAPVGRARTACHRASRESGILMHRIDGIWTSRSQAAASSADQLSALDQLDAACDRLLNTLDHLIVSVNAIPASDPVADQGQ